jgi:peptidoglycan/LPS O-acetylase OafA/YrhL
VLPIVFLAAGIFLVYLCNALNIPAFQNFQFILNYTFFGRAWEFILGLLLALLYTKHNRKISDWYNNFHGINWLLCLSILSVIYCMYHFREPGKFGYEGITGIMLNNLVLPVFTGLFYVGLMIRKDIFARLLSSPIAIIGGKASYIFYLIHVGFIRSLLSIYIDDFFPDNIWRWAVKNISLIVISIGLYYLLEEPLNKQIKKWFR